MMLPGCGVPSPELRIARQLFIVVFPVFSIAESSDACGAWAGGFPCVSLLSTGAESPLQWWADVGHSSGKEVDGLPTAEHRPALGLEVKEWQIFRKLSVFSGFNDGNQLGDVKQSIQKCVKVCAPDRRSSSHRC